MISKDKIQRNIEKNNKNPLEILNNEKNKNSNKNFFNNKQIIIKIKNRNIFKIILLMLFITFIIILIVFLKKLFIKKKINKKVVLLKEKNNDILNKIEDDNNNKKEVESPENIDQNQIKQKYTQWKNEFKKSILPLTKKEPIPQVEEIIPVLKEIFSLELQENLSETNQNDSYSLNISINTKEKIKNIFIMLKILQDNLIKDNKTFKHFSIDNIKYGIRLNQEDLSCLSISLLNIKIGFNTLNSSFWINFYQFLFTLSYQEECLILKTVDKNIYIRDNDNFHLMKLQIKELLKIINDI